MLRYTPEPRGDAEQPWVRQIMKLAFTAISIRINTAGICGKVITADQPFLNAAMYGCLEQLTEQLTIAKAPMPVLGECEMVGHSAVQT